MAKIQIFKVSNLVIACGDDKSDPSDLPGYDQMDNAGRRSLAETIRHGAVALYILKESDEDQSVSNLMERAIGRKIDLSGFTMEELQVLLKAGLRINKEREPSKFVELAEWVSFSPELIPYVIKVLKSIRDMIEELKPLLIT